MPEHPRNFFISSILLLVLFLEDAHLPRRPLGPWTALIPDLLISIDIQIRTCIWESGSSEGGVFCLHGVVLEEDVDVAGHRDLKEQVRPVLRERFRGRFKCAKRVKKR